MKDSKLKVYNTLTGEKEIFKPLCEGKVGIYVCGPTTYNFIHLGNARPIVVFDTIRRYLEYRGYEVKYIQNFTDVDDKIINRAKAENLPAHELAQTYIDEYFKDADALNVKRADVHPKVSEHMGEIIEFVKGLVEKGFAYTVDGDVYFAVKRFKDYGKLSKRNIEELQAGARVEADERKEHPGDFALWKKAKPGEPQWDSPWGKGRPGWHIECSAMSGKYLGCSFDMHGGGFDLIFPHHENEIAQSEALNGEQMAKYWVHNGFITVKQEKMSKSLGNFFLLRDIFKKFSPDVVRFYLLSTHYRSPLDFDDEKLEIAQKGLARLRTAYRLLKEKANESGLVKAFDGEKEIKEFEEGVAEHRRRFNEAMDDDFNTALAIAELFDLARLINNFTAGGVAQNAQGVISKAGKAYHDLAGVLGIRLEQENADSSSELTEALIRLLLDTRLVAKKKKDYQIADEIRSGLQELGIIIEDTPQSTRWRRGEN